MTAKTCVSAHGDVQSDRETGEVLFRGGVLVALVDLLPEREVVVCARVLVKRRALDAVEHDERHLV